MRSNCSSSPAREARARRATDVAGLFHCAPSGPFPAMLRPFYNPLRNTIKAGWLGSIHLRIQVQARMES
jgi:hypothetical protein